MNEQGAEVYKGLQKPLEFMGIRGRFITLSAAAIGCSFIGFLAASMIGGKLMGFITMVAMIILSLITIYAKQRRGLHSKSRYRGIVVYKTLFRH